MMEIQDGAIDRVLEDCVRVLRSVQTERDSDRKPYAVDLRRLLDSALVLRFGEYLQFLEKFGFLKFDRRSDLLTLTRPGRELIEGKLSRSESLKGDASHHFGARLNEVDIPMDGEEAQQTVLDGRYLIHTELGVGSLGRVNAANQISLNQPVAVKRFSGLTSLFSGGLTPALRRQLRTTIEMNAHIDSQFTLSILEMNVDADLPYCVSELCMGGNLRRLMDAQALEPRVALEVFYQMVLGLQAAHGAGVVHGDLKPENILLTGKGNVKITDFGFSRLAQTDEGAQKRAYVGYASLGYLAPEMFRQDRTYTVGADIYALGIILYELLVGRLPGRRSPMPSQVVEGLPSGVDDLFDAMADDDHAERIESMDKVLEKLNVIMGRSDTSDQAVIFLKPPFELPGWNNLDLSMLRLEQSSSESVDQDLESEREDKQTQDVGDAFESVFDEFEGRGLETLNASAVEAIAEEEPSMTLGASLADENKSEDNLGSNFETVVSAHSGGVASPTMSPVSNGDPSVALDDRSATQVSKNPDQTSVLDSVLDE